LLLCDSSLDIKQLTSQLGPLEKEGNSWTEFAFFVLYSYGRPGYPTTDYGKALGFLRKAAEAGRPEAQYGLATVYNQKSEFAKHFPVTKDTSSAVEWAQLAARQKYGPALIFLYSYYVDPQGGNDPIKARTYLEQGAAAHYAAALRIMGENYYSGDLGQQDRKKAGQLLMDAAQMGDRKAQFELSNLYDKGEDACVRASLPKCDEYSRERDYWLLRAAQQRYEPARQDLECTEWPMNWFQEVLRKYPADFTSQEIEEMSKLPWPNSPSEAPESTLNCVCHSRLAPQDGGCGLLAVQIALNGKSAAQNRAREIRKKAILTCLRCTEFSVESRKSRPRLGGSMSQ